MKTVIRSIRNYMDIPFDPVTEVITADELRSEVDNEIFRELMARKSYEEPDAAAAGDIAELRLESGNERFNRSNLRLNIGLGLFSSELESTLPGRRKGESYTAHAGGSEVRVTVLSLERKVDAVLDDAFVQSLGIGGVSDVEGYRAHLEKKFIDFFREAYVEYHAMDLFEEMMGASDITYCDEDIRPFLEQLGGEDPDETGEEDARFVLWLYLADSIARGVDYRSDEELPHGSKELNSLRDRVIAPLMRYIDDKVKIEVIEEEE